MSVILSITDVNHAVFSWRSYVSRNHLETCLGGVFSTIWHEGCDSWPLKSGTLTSDSVTQSSPENDQSATSSFLYFFSRITSTSEPK